MGSSITKGTASPVKIVSLKTSAITTPTTMPSRYRQVMTCQALSGKNALMKKP